MAQLNTVYVYQKFLTKDREEIFSLLKTQSGGLAAEEARLRLARDGPNRLPRHQAHGLLVFVRQFKNPFVYLLFVAALVAWIAGHGIDALTIALVLLVNGGLGFTQEYRAERALEKLEELLVPQAKVLRGGRPELRPVHELVGGDLVPLEAGDRAAADLRVVESRGLVIDESVLTGESEDRPKHADPLPAAETELSGAANTIFAGTFIRSGRGLGLVVATAGETVLGRIAHRIRQIERKSGFEEHLEHFSGVMMRVVVVTIFLLLLLHIVVGRQEPMVELILFVLALAVSVVPEGLPIVTTVALAHGAAQLAKKSRVVVRRLSALEDLGNIDLLCTDKTGTITENKLTVEKVLAPDQKRFLELVLVEAAYLAERTPGGFEGLNSFDRALADLSAILTPTLSPRGRGQGRGGTPSIIWDLPFDPATRLSAVATERDGQPFLIVRGAPEAILERSSLGAPEREKIRDECAEAGQNGRRVFALATHLFSPSPFLGEGRVRAEELLQNLTWEGYATFTDPLKPGAKAALHRARALGVDLRIITGDSPEVAFAISREIGLTTDRAQVITGQELRGLPPDQYEERVEKTKVFARIAPEEKLMIIESLQKKHAVGFLGEGVNDAPALERANVAIVVENAAAVSREAADIVLLLKDLGIIVEAIAHGRRIFENVAKYLKYTLIGNFGNFYAMAGVSLILPFIPILPVQILLTNLLTDLPLMAVSVDQVSREAILEPRRFSVPELMRLALIFGLVSALFDFICFGIFWKEGAPVFRTAWFVFSILTELMLIYSIRAPGWFFRGARPGIPLAALTVGAALFTIALPTLPWGEKVFKLVPLGSQAFITIVVLALGYFVTTEVVKQFLIRRLPLPRPERAG